MPAWVRVVVFPHPVLASQGTADFSDEWCRENGDPPERLILRRTTSPRKTVILRGIRRQGPNKDVAVTPDVFGSLRVGDPGEDEGVHAECRSASFAARIWYSPGGRIDVTAAVASAALAVVSGIVSFSTGKSVAMIPLIVFVLATIAAVTKLASDVRRAAGS